MAKKNPHDQESLVLVEMARHGKDEGRAHKVFDQLGFSIPVKISSLKLKYAGEDVESNHPVSLASSHMGNSFV